jgi:hypothetical protein
LHLRKQYGKQSKRKHPETGIINIEDYMLYKRSAQTQIGKVTANGNQGDKEYKESKL